MRKPSRAQRRGDETGSRVQAAAAPSAATRAEQLRDVDYLCALYKYRALAAVVAADAELKVQEV